MLTSFAAPRPIAVVLATLSLGAGVVLACGSEVDDKNNASSSSSSGSSSGGFNNGDGGATGEGGTSSGDNCNPNLTGLVRDFQGKDNEAGITGHPDFQAYSATDPTKQLVKEDLGPDKKPVFNSSTGDGSHGQQITSKESFDQWYRDTDGVNQSFQFVLPLQPASDGVLTFNSNSFFPIDGKGFGNSGLDTNDQPHNFHFTFELHLEFVYRGGEVFTFTGDDDLWTFFNNKLGIDLGGLHPAKSATVNLDAVADKLGIVKGNKYPLDVFHAERRTNASNFRIDTTLEFVNCDPIIVPK